MLLYDRKDCIIYKQCRCAKWIDRVVSLNTLLKRKNQLFMTKIEKFYQIVYPLFQHQPYRLYMHWLLITDLI